MFHVVESIIPLTEFRLFVLFRDGTRKIYDVSNLFDKYEMFLPLRDVPALFEQVRRDPGGHGISWNDEIDISSEELWDNGTLYKS